MKKSYRCGDSWVFVLLLELLYDRASCTHLERFPMIAMIAKVISLRERSTSIRQILEERQELRYYLVRSITRGIEIFLAWILWRIYDFESLYVFMFPPIIYTVIDFCGQKIFTFKTDSLWTRKILGVSAVSVCAHSYDHHYPYCYWHACRKTRV